MGIAYNVLNHGEQCTRRASPPQMTQYVFSSPVLSDSNKLPTLQTSNDELKGDGKPGFTFSIFSEEARSSAWLRSDY